eukprot:1157628-Pelagomonas_calceolata.AAC.2
MMSCTLVDIARGGAKRTENTRVGEWEGLVIRAGGDPSGPGTGLGSKSEQGGWAQQGFKICGCEAVYILEQLKNANGLSFILKRLGSRGSGRDCFDAKLWHLTVRGAVLLAGRFY